MNAGTEIDVRADLARIFREEAAGLTGALARRTGDFALAEECVQDALVRALEHWPRDGIPDRPGAWLMTVARNRALDRLRRDRVERCNSSSWKSRDGIPTTAWTRSSRAAIRRLRGKRNSR